MGAEQAETIAYQAVFAAAEAGAPCPSADDLAEALGFRSVSGTVDVLHRLERRGLIKVDRYQRGRQVTIVSTGKKTAEPSCRVSHWRIARPPVPTPPIAMIRERKPDVARDIEMAARRDGRALQDYLGDLVFAGWSAIQADVGKG